MLRALVDTLPPKDWMSSSHEENSVATRSSTMQDALENLGVRPDTLTQLEKDQLDQEGYLPLSGVLTPDHLASLRARVDELLQAEGDQAGTEFRQEAGTERLSDLVNKGAVFDFNSHLWHGGTLNATAARRRALHAYFCRRTERQQIDQQRFARTETRARLSPAARYVLGIDEV